MFETEIARGAALLDEEMPGWELKLDLGTLDFPSLDDCVLGQLYGGYHQGLRLLHHPNATDIGVFRMGASWANYQTMRDEWVAEVKRRLDAGLTFPETP